MSKSKKLEKKLPGGTVIVSVSNTNTEVSTKEDIEKDFINRFSPEIPEVPEIPCAPNPSPKSTDDSSKGLCTCLLSSSSEKIQPICQKSLSCDLDDLKNLDSEENLFFLSPKIGSPRSIRSQKSNFDIVKKSTTISFKDIRQSFADDDQVDISLPKKTSSLQVNDSYYKVPDIPMSRVQFSEELSGKDPQKRSEPEEVRPCPWCLDKISLSKEWIRRPRTAHPITASPGTSKILPEKPPIKEDSGIIGKPEIPSREMYWKEKSATKKESGVPGTLEDSSGDKSVVPEKLGTPPRAISGVPEVFSTDSKQISGIPDKSGAISRIKSAVPEKTDFLSRDMNGSPEKSGAISRIKSAVPETSEYLSRDMPGSPEKSGAISRIKSAAEKLETPPRVISGVPEVSSAISRQISGIPEQSGAFYREISVVPEVFKDVSRVSRVPEKSGTTSRIKSAVPGKSETPPRVISGVPEVSSAISRQISGIPEQSGAFYREMSVVPEVFKDVSGVSRVPEKSGTISRIKSAVPGKAETSSRVISGVPEVSSAISRQISGTPEQSGAFYREISVVPEVFKDVSGVSRVPEKSGTVSRIKSAVPEKSETSPRVTSGAPEVCSPTCREVSGIPDQSEAFYREISEVPEEFKDVSSVSRVLEKSGTISRIKSAVPGKLATPPKALSGVPKISGTSSRPKSAFPGKSGTFPRSKTAVPGKSATFSSEIYGDPEKSSTFSKMSGVSGKSGELSDLGSPKRDISAVASAFKFETPIRKVEIDGSQSGQVTSPQKSPISISGKRSPLKKEESCKMDKSTCQDPCDSCLKSPSLKDQMESLSIIGDSMELVKLEESRQLLETQDDMASEIWSKAEITRADSEISDFLDDNIPDLPDDKDNAYMYSLSWSKKALFSKMDQHSPSLLPDNGSDNTYMYSLDWSKKALFSKLDQQSANIGSSQIEPREFLDEEIQVGPRVDMGSQVSATMLRDTGILEPTLRESSISSSEEKIGEDLEDDVVVCSRLCELIKHVPECCFFNKTKGEIVRAVLAQPTASVCSCWKKTDSEILEAYKLQHPSLEKFQEPIPEPCTCKIHSSQFGEYEIDYNFVNYVCTCLEMSSESKISSQRTSGSTLESEEHPAWLVEPEEKTQGTSSSSDVCSCELQEAKKSEEKFYKKFGKSELIDYDKLLEEEVEDFFEFEASKKKSEDRYDPRSEAELYLVDHRIQDVFQFLCSQLLAHVPDNPIMFLISLLDKCLKYREGLGTPPLLFTEKHVESMFKSLTIMGNDFIDKKAYKIGMQTLQIKDYHFPEASNNFIHKDVFINEAMKSMMEDLNGMIRVVPKRPTNAKSRRNVGRKKLFYSTSGTTTSFGSATFDTIF